MSRMAASPRVTIAMREIIEQPSLVGMGRKTHL
jgi:hypothetical protein